MASQYNLQLKATLDTQQVQQQLQQLRAAQMSASNGQSTAKGAQIGMGSFSKLDATLTKLNSSVNALQRTIEQLNKINQQSFTALTKSGSQKTVDGIPIAPNSSGQIQFITRKWRSTYNNVVKNDPNLIAKAVEKYGTSNPDILGEMYAKKFDTDNYNANLKDRRFVQSKLRQIHAMRQNRQFAAIIGGQLFGGAGELATGFGYNKTGAVLGGIGQGITAGGSMALGATMLGAGAAAGPIGLVVGLGAAALAVTKSLNEMNEAAKKAAEIQAKTAEALRTNAVGQSLDRYSTWQKQRADEVMRENNLPVAKERAEYFKTQLEKARSQFYQVGDPAAYEKKIREEAERNKNATVTERRAVTGGGTATGGYYTTVEEYQRQKTDEEKAEIDKAANEAIEAQQKKFAAAKRELQAAEANAQVWKDVADKLKESKEADEKLGRERRQKEAAERNAIVRQSNELKYQLKDQESIRTTQIYATNVLREKNGPLSAFNKLSEELTELRAVRKDLRTEAFAINRDIELNGRNKTALEVKDMAKRRDDLLHRASILGERAEILETALGNIDVSKLAHNPDLSHVTSLAQYGFNMGEKDDTVERMEKYYSKSINLQQQIKDKIEQGIKTEAVYN